MLQVNHIIFLIHPGCYENLDADTIRDANHAIYVEWERVAKQRWIESLAARPSDTLFVQLYGPQGLFDTAVEHLGPAWAVYLKAPFPEDEDMREYHRRLLAVLHAHLKGYDLELRPSFGVSRSRVASLVTAARLPSIWDLRCPRKCGLR